MSRLRGMALLPYSAAETEDGLVADFDAVVKTRRSVRQYLPTRGSRRRHDEVLDAAQCAPSNCNTDAAVAGAHFVRRGQGRVHEPADHRRLRRRRRYQRFLASLSMIMALRVRHGLEQGAAYYQSARHLSRQHRPAPRRPQTANLSFFGAPHVALLFAPSVGDNVRVAADLSGCTRKRFCCLWSPTGWPVCATMLGSYAEQARALLNCASEMAAVRHLVRLPDANTQRHSTASDGYPTRRASFTTAT